MNPFYATPSPSNKTTCGRCKGTIGLGTLRVQWRSYFMTHAFYYHLRCFKPAPPVPITLGKNFFICSQEQKHLDQGKKWAEKWNQQFAISDTDIATKYLTKQVPTISTPHRRLWLEIFMFITIEDMEKTLAFVSKEWFHFTRDEELWKRRFLLEWKPSETDSESSYRKEYIRLSYSSCMRCRKRIELVDIAYKCPLHKRPVCHTCAHQLGCYPVTVSSYCKKWKVSVELLKRLLVPTFLFNHVKSMYQSDFLKCALPYYTQRYKLLLKELEEQYRDQVTDEEWQELAQLNIAEIFTGSKLCERVGFAVLLFCGKDEKREDLQRSVDTVLETLVKYRHK